MRSCKMSIRRLPYSLYWRSSLALFAGFSRPRCCCGIVFRLIKLGALTKAVSVLWASSLSMLSRSLLAHRVPGPWRCAAAGWLIRGTVIGTIWWRAGGGDIHGDLPERGLAFLPVHII